MNSILEASNGTVDTNFAMGSEFNGSVATISPVGDGSADIYVGGDFPSYNFGRRNRIVRLQSDGSTDTSFSIVVGLGGGFNDAVNSLIPFGDDTGRVYVGGVFTSYQNTTVGRIARLNPDGTLN